MNTNKKTPLQQAILDGLAEVCSGKCLTDAQVKRLATMTPEAIRLWALEIQEQEIAKIERHVLDFYHRQFVRPFQRHGK